MVLEIQSGISNKCIEATEKILPCCFYEYFFDMNAGNNNKKKDLGVPVVVQWVKNLHWLGLLPRPGPMQWVKDPTRVSATAAAAAAAWIQSLAWDLPYAIGVATKK